MLVPGLPLPGRRPPSPSRRRAQTVPRARVVGRRFDSPARPQVRLVPALQAAQEVRQAPAVFAIGIRRVHSEEYLESLRKVSNPLEEVRILNARPG